MWDAPGVAPDICVELDRLHPLLREHRWGEVEGTVREVCALLAGAECAERIGAVDTSGYQAELHRLAEHTAAHCPPDAQAIYFEFDPDSAWESDFFVCSEAPLMEAAEEEWACDWLHHVSGPEFEPFARLYEEHGGYGRTPSSAGTALYLIARTVCAYGRAVEGVDFGARSVCVAFHDAADVLWVRELR